MTPTRLVTEAELAAAEQNVRAFIWRNHGHAGPALYGDDGEMQCKACRLWDYRKEALPALLAQAELALAALPERPIDRCDRVVNNGAGEPTECGRVLPCEVHEPERPALDVDLLELALIEAENNGLFGVSYLPDIAAAAILAAYERLSRERAGEGTDG